MRNLTEQQCVAPLTAAKRQTSIFALHQMVLTQHIAVNRTTYLSISVAQHCITMQKVPQEVARISAVGELASQMKHCPSLHK